MDGRSDVCVPSDMHSATFPTTSEVTKLPPSLDSSSVEPLRQMVVPVDQLQEEMSNQVPSDGDTLAPITFASRPPETRSTESATVLTREGRLKATKFADVIERLENSRASSTRIHYRSQRELFKAWTAERRLNPLDVSLPLLTNFMDYLF